MNRDELELALQDYLDGRMDAAERERFEAQVADDPDLAEMLAAYREAGDALRDGVDDELPAGFYETARERFEAEHPRRRIHDAFRWENAGLLAAALLVAAILMPVVWQEGMMRDAGLEATEQKPAQAPAVARSEQESDTLDEIRAVGEIEAKPDELQDRPAPAFAPSPEDDAALDADADAGRKDEFKKAMAKEKGAAGPVEEQVESEAGAGFAEPARETAPPSVAYRRQAEPEPVAQAPADPVTPSTAAGADAPAKLSRTRNEARDAFDAEEVVTSDRTVPRGAPAPTGVLPAGAVIHVTTAEAWARWLRRIEGLGAERLAPRFPNEHVVLVGSRPEPLDCASVVSMPDGAVGVPVSPSGRGDAGGCAVVVPVDRIEIEFLYHEGAR